MDLDLVGRVLAILGIAAGISLLLAAILLGLTFRTLRRIDLPADAGFWTTLRAVPLPLVVVLDLLDFGLDFLSAPIAWALLGKLRLHGLKEVATVQALVPVTGPIPVLTLSWIAARALGLGDVSRPRDPNVIETEEVEPGRWKAKD